MVETLSGNLFDSKAQTLVNTVNCAGIMGKGIALEFRKRFPEMYEDYLCRCNRKEVKLGFPYVYKNLIPPYVLNFPTKEHWRSDSKLEDIIKGLEYLVKMYKEWDITSLAVPPLGCGQGQLEWQVVGTTIYRYLSKMHIVIELYVPYVALDEEPRSGFLEHDIDTEMPKSRRIQPAWVAIVDILDHIEKQTSKNQINQAMFQKLAYTAMAEILSTDPDSFNTFSQDLKNGIIRMINNGLIYKERMGNMHAFGVGPTFNDAKKLYASYLDRWKSTIDKVACMFIEKNNDK